MKDNQAILTDELWERVESLLPKPPMCPQGGRPRANDRECFGGIIWVLRSGARWRDLPSHFPSAPTCWRRHRDWTEAGVWETVWGFASCRTRRVRDSEARRIVSGCHLRAGKKRGEEIGKTKRGKGIKVELVIDGAGTPLAALSAAANIAEVDLAEPVLEEIPLPLAKPVPVVADKGYDSDPLRERLAQKGFDLISPHRGNRQRPRTVDGRKLRRYRRRWLVERSAGWLQNFRRIVTRWDYC